MKKQVEKRGFSGFSDEMCMVLLALPYGDEDVKPHIAEKSVLGVRKTFKFIETSVKNENMHEIGREKTFSRFDQWNRHSFLARISLS